MRIKNPGLVEWTAIACLLAVAVGVPVAQAVNEISAGRTPFLLELFQRFPTKANLHGWDRQVRDNSIVAKAIRPTVLQCQFDLFGDAGAKALVGREGWLFYKPDVDFLVQPRIDQDRFYLGAFDTTLDGRRQNLRNPMVAIRDVHRQLAKRGIRLVVVPVPGKPSIYPEMLAGPIAPLEVSPTLDLLDSLRASGIDAVDLVRPLRAAKPSTTTALYLERDTHWSPTGVGIAADVIARHLSLIPDVSSRRDSTRFRARDTLVERWGDLSEMSNLPRRREIWSTESVKAHQVVDSGDRLYADSDSAAVLWLGDSYSRIYQTDAPRAAGIIAQVALRLGQPLSSVVNDGGASTVVRQKLSRKSELLRHAKVVVWEFVERDVRFGDKGWSLERIP